MYKEFPTNTLNNEFTIVKEVKNGAEGTKQLVHYKNDTKEEKDLYLVKILPCNKKEDKERYEREMKVIRSLNHNNIAKIVKTYCEDNKLFIFFPYYAGGSISDIFEDKPRLSEEDAKRYFLQMVDAVSYCHKQGIIHRDIKPDNVLLDASKENAYLADFGLCVEVKEGELLNDFPGTPLYNAPEKYKGVPYCGVKSDIWSLGVTLYEMITGDTPFFPYKTKSIQELARKVVYQHVLFPPYVK